MKIDELDTNVGIIGFSVTDSDEGTNGKYRIIKVGKRWHAQKTDRNKLPESPRLFDSVKECLEWVKDNFTMTEAKWFLNEELLNEWANED